VRQSNSKLLSIHTPEAMRHLGLELGTALRGLHGASRCITFEGDLGAGKTTLVGGVLKAFGIEGPVRSPTYTLIEPYEADGRSIYHLDLYRLTDPNEIEPLGLRDLLVPDSILLIEWPSRAAGRLRVPDLSIWIEYSEPPQSGRNVRLELGSAGTAEVLERLLR
jgi:tRNA threonylcarbamoyladenosine biosynthesis protein TsaE